MLPSRNRIFIVMQGFNSAILSRLCQQGYPYMLYYNMEHFGILVPLLEECETNEASYIIPITDDLLAEMAGGIDNFSIYVFS